MRISLKLNFQIFINFSILCNFMVKFANTYEYLHLQFNIAVPGRVNLDRVCFLE